jgi:hypothetical protein
VSVDLRATLVGRTARPVQVLDMSLLGCLVRGAVALDPGAVVDLRIEMPDGPLPAKARVAEASVDGASLPEGGSFLAGLEFLGLAALDEQRLRAFVEQASRRRRGANPLAP